MNAIQLKQMFEESLQRGENRSVFSDLNLLNQRIEEQKLACCDFVNCDFSGTVFIGCDLRGSDFSRSTMRNVTLIRCKIYGSVLPYREVSLQIVEPLQQLTGETGSKERDQNAHWSLLLIQKLQNFRAVSASSITSLTLLLAIIAIIIALLNK